MADRKLNHSERGISLFGGERARDRADAKRQIEGLSQQDQVIALLNEQNALLAELVGVQRWMADRMHEAQTGASG